MTSTLAPLLLAALAHGESDDVPTWSGDVRPLLAEHCFACHGPDPDARKAGLRLDARASWTNADVEELLYRVTTDQEFDRMPPPVHGEGLGAGDVERLRRWIEAGAAWEPHWAYAPLATEAVDGNVVDRFVQRRLAAEGLEPAPEADPRALLRRLHLDLVGMPPTDDELAAFVADPSNAAYERRVDELLSSVRFGEHWARHWLDVARYADSHGFTIDGGRSVWPWRDWVVDAIASDMPFDAFTVQQIAGDLLPDATRAQRIATGFHRNTQVNQEGGAKDEENRVSAVHDRVATTGAVWLGATIGCAQCHAHKFDPVTHAEYYGLFAFFDSTTDGGVSAGPSLLVPRNAEEEATASAWEAELRERERAHAAAASHASRGWTRWQPERATGSNGPELRPEEDGSYRVIGQNPVYSTYVLEGAPPLERIAAIRIEALPDGGPGRSGNRNFVLQEIRVAAGAEEWTDVELVAARADHEQDTRGNGGGQYPVRGALPGDDGQGWAISPEFDAPHAAEFILREPLELEDGDRLRIELQQEHGDRHTLGAFRVAMIESDPGSERSLVGDAWRDAWSALREHRAQRPRLPSTLVLEERHQPRTTRRFHRGSFLDPREPVTPGVPEAWDGFRAMPDAAPLDDRLDFARWLVHPDNALVQRVTVNRWWQALFGRGLVATENDFGLRGARPTHPGLLDQLAHELVASGFSRRHVLRTIVLSSTYRQASVASPALRERDPENVLLARQRRLRLSGEQLRDSMLVVAGVLDDAVGGPPVQPPQPGGVYAFTQSQRTWTPSVGTARFRRSLYTRLWRSAPFPFFTTFDAPTPNVTCTRRTTSRSPLQALALANDPMVVELSEAFGARIEAAWGDLDDGARTQRAFETALGRHATDTEVARLIEHVEAVRELRGESAAWASLARVLFNLGEFTHRP